MNALWGENVEFLNVGLHDKYSNHWALKHGHPAFLCQKATPVIVGWFTRRTWKNNNKWYM